jgi:hypothetical protein
MSRAWIALAALFLLVVFPDAVLACPVCFSASDENREAFLATTAFLSLLPLGMVGGAGLWLRKRSRAIDAEAESELTAMESGDDIS